MITINPNDRDEPNDPADDPEHQGPNTKD